MEPAQVPRSRIVLIVAAVGGFLTAQALLLQVASGRRVDLAGDLLRELLYWAFWALFTPLIARAARQWPLDRKPWYRPVGAHAAISIVLAPVHAALVFGSHTLLMQLLGAHPAPPLAVWLVQTRPLILWGFFTGVYFYWVLIGAITAFRYQRLYAAEQVSAAELLGHRARLEGELVGARLQALRAQLRPHFLFNTLNAIGVLTADEPDKARRMLLQLASLLRRSLDTDRNEVPLSDELQLFDDYVGIQRVRFGDRLVVERHVDPAAATTPVPALLLQPLVENAIVHGSALRDGVTRIVLRANASGETVRLSITDNGPGFAVLPPAEGIGLRNTRERLHGLYGSGAALRFSRGAGADGTGACVEVIVPRGGAA